MIQPRSHEEAYERLTGYRFARRYVEGKSVANICRDEAGYGARALAGSAASVTALDGKAELPGLPCPDGSLGAAVALGVIGTLDELEALVAEAKRVLKEDGLFIVSTPDKQSHSLDRNYHDPANGDGMFVPELRELLEQQFRHVEVFRLGSVAGGMVLPAEEDDLSVAGIEAASIYSLSFDAGPPLTLSILAVCSDSQIPQREDKRPYLLLDRERSVFEECEERREDVELLREEVRRVQETEVQAFEEALQRHGSENLSLRDEIRRYKAQLQHLRGRNEKLQQGTAHAENAEKLRTRLSETQERNERLRNRLAEIENSYAWRLLKLYRRLRRS